MSEPSTATDGSALVIAESQALQRSLGANTRDTGFARTRVVHPSEAEAAVGESLYDLYVIEEHLAGRRDASLVRQIKDRYVDAPVLVVSGESPGEAMEFALNAGATAAITQPFTAGTFRRKVRAAMNDPRRKRATQRVPAPDHLKAQLTAADSEAALSASLGDLSLGGMQAVVAGHPGDASLLSCYHVTITGPGVEFEAAAELVNASLDDRSESMTHTVRLGFRFVDLSEAGRTYIQSLTEGAV